MDRLADPSSSREVNEVVEPGCRLSGELALRLWAWLPVIVDRVGVKHAFEPAMFTVHVDVWLVDPGVLVIGQVILIFCLPCWTRSPATIVIASRGVGNLPWGSSSAVSASAKQQ